MKGNTQNFVNNISRISLWKAFEVCTDPEEDTGEYPPDSLIRMEDGRNLVEDILW